MYEYRATCLEVIDGDTIRAHVDLGFSTWHEERRLRLLGLDTPELHAKDSAVRLRAEAARDRVRGLLPVDATFTVRTVKDRQEKYGGYLASITLDDGTDLNALLLREKLAVPYSGGARG